MSKAVSCLFVLFLICFPFEVWIVAGTTTSFPFPEMRGEISYSATLSLLMLALSSGELILDQVTLSLRRMILLAAQQPMFRPGIRSVGKRCSRGGRQRTKGRKRRSGRNRRRVRRAGQGRGWHRVLKQIRLIKRLEPVLQEVAQEAISQTQRVGGASDPPTTKLSQMRIPVQVVVVRPEYDQACCPRCQGTTEFVKSYYIHPQDLDLERPTRLQVYREIRRCTACGHVFAPELDFMEPGGRFTMRVKQKVLACVQEDGMPVNRVPARMARDFHVSLSVSTVHDWVHKEAERDLGEAEYTQWVTARFSGVIGLDEAHEVDEHGRKKYLIVAVDPLNGRTILFDLLDSRDHIAIEGFLQQLKAMGIRPEVVITDMWKAYRQAILAVFPDAKQQLCVFHVIQDVMKYVNKAILTYRRQLPQQTKQQKAARKEIWEFRYPLLKFSGKLTAKQRDQVEDILAYHQGTLLAEAYRLKEAVLALFRESQTKEAARYRRDMIVERFKNIPELKQIIDLLSGEQFEQMIVYLDYENLDKTNNDAERTNRSYRKGEKNRYKARTDHTRLNYMRLEARQRNARNAARDEKLKLKARHRQATIARLDAYVEQEAKRLAA